MIEKWEIEELLKLDMIIGVVSRVPQIIKYSINLNHIPDLYVQVTIIVCQISVLKNIYT